MEKHTLAGIITALAIGFFAYHIGLFLGIATAQANFHKEYCLNKYVNIAASEVGDECKDVFDNQ